MRSFILEGWAYLHPRSSETASHGAVSKANVGHYDQLTWWPGNAGFLFLVLVHEKKSKELLKMS